MTDASKLNDAVLAVADAEAALLREQQAIAFANYRNALVDLIASWDATADSDLEELFYAHDDRIKAAMHQWLTDYRLEVERQLSEMAQQPVEVLLADSLARDLQGAKEAVDDFFAVTG